MASPRSPCFSCGRSSEPPNCWAARILPTLPIATLRPVSSADVQHIWGASELRTEFSDSARRPPHPLELLQGPAPSGLTSRPPLGLCLRKGDQQFQSGLCNWVAFQQPRDESLNFPPLLRKWVSASPSHLAFSQPVTSCPQVRPVVPEGAV